MGKKLVDMTRDELYGVVRQLLAVLERKRTRYLPDLPPNKRANARHQRMKHIWAKKKKRLLNMLAECLPHLPDDLAGRAKYEIDHDEHLYQKHAHKKRNTSRSRRRERRAREVT